jgi:DNA-directed RNA polymerase subunit D
MEIQKINTKNSELKFIIKGVTPAYVNAIRRFGMDYVPTLAIEDVEIVKNTSIMYDEILAHRLGLIPLTTDLKSYTLPEGEINAMNSVVLTLNENEPSMIHSKNFNTKDPKVKPVFDDFQIVELLEGQELELIATAVMGQGKVHAKWSPANIYYSYEPIIEVNSPKDISKFPPQVIKNGKIDKSLINTPELVDACTGVSDEVKVTYKKDSFILTVESFGQLPSEEILVEVTNQFNTQLDELSKLIKEIKN